MALSNEFVNALALIHVNAPVHSNGAFDRGLHCTPFSHLLTLVTLHTDGDPVTYYQCTVGLPTIITMYAIKVYQKGISVTN